MQQEPQFFGTRDVARILNVDETVVRDLTRAGVASPQRMSSGARIWTQSDIELLARHLAGAKRSKA